VTGANIPEKRWFGLAFALKIWYNGGVISALGRIGLVALKQ
jgi:hypothetical protein